MIDRRMKMLFLGDMTYKGVNFSFGFDGKQLELISRPGEQSNALELMPGFHSSGVYYSTGIGMPIESDYLKLSPSNAPKELILFPDSKTFTSTSIFQGSFRVGARAYCVLNPNAQIVGLRFHSPHLSKCYSDKTAVGMQYERETRQFSVHTENCKPLSSKFQFKGTTIFSDLFYTYKMCFTPGESPLAVESTLEFRFEAERDFSFIFELALLARSFLNYCLQVSGAEFDSIELLAEKQIDGLHQNGFESRKIVVRCGKLVLCHGSTESIGSAKYHIPLGVREGFEKALFQMLAGEELSLRHLPPLNKVRAWDNARIILLAASFDQEANLLYPDGIHHSQSTLNARQTVIDALSEIKGSVKTRKLANRLIEYAKTGDSFSSRMFQIYKDHPVFIEKLCHTANSEEAFNGLTNRVQELRNSLAHGKLEINYGNSLLDDVLVLEKLVLAIQLFRLGLEDEAVIQTIQTAEAR